jgi:2-(1,2-epoxy-1,2-dihydrophenyl)acetyl-CoA isomerase
VVDPQPIRRRDGAVTEPVLVDTQGGVTTVTLNRPQRLNALSPDLLVRLRQALEELAEDEATRVVVLTGAGRAFCAGGDVGDLVRVDAEDGPTTGRARSVDDLAGETRGHVRMAELLQRMPKPTIAAVNGPCAGAGFALACAADLRYAAASAVFTTGFIRVGQTGDYGGAWTASRLLGAAKARELFLLSDRIDAAEAQRIGLVSGVVPDTELHEAVQAIARRLTGFSPGAIAAMKANMNDAAALDLPAYLDVECRRFAENLQTRDAIEAARAFVEKRAPDFEGR